MPAMRLRHQQATGGAGGRAAWEEGCTHITSRQSPSVRAQAPPSARRPAPTQPNPPNPTRPTRPLPPPPCHYLPPTHTQLRTNNSYVPRAACPHCTREQACPPGRPDCAITGAHGGAGMIFSVGLLRQAALSYDNALACMRSIFGCSGGDGLVSQVGGLGG